MHALWPYPTVNRYLNFYTLFRAKRTQLFALYEQQDGDYHGPERYTGASAAATSAATSASAETGGGDSGSEEEEFDDAEFV